MGRNIFISYKYKDDKVYTMNKKKLIFVGENMKFVARPSIVRDYVDKLQTTLKEDHINLGEKDGESLANFKDSTIETSLKNKIFGSSITIILISKGMKISNELEKDQWIPWEVSYSLRTVTREDRKSRMNAILGVVLPDENNSYDWYYTKNTKCDCITHHYGQLFDILKSNMFNIKEPTIRECDGIKISEGEFSYIKTVEWGSFTNNYNFYIEKAIEIRDNKDKYTLKINLD